jgi:hypothetical protein
MIGPFAQFLEECIVAQYTMSGTPQQNGVVERRNRTLMDIVSEPAFMPICSSSILHLFIVHVLFCCFASVPNVLSHTSRTVEGFT